MAPSAARQEATSVMAAVRSRPAMPPNPVPPMYSPIARPMEPRPISSLR
jgi:hypothetical protein